ncbi:hypothetical protein [Pseudaestuariivita atlantica]|uniref:Uncharacterized protein n=1 Tax=Pseudaestuariivita atlantica TaxID=1317121 RepID=A0A0L1JPD1_9RHOB|nr:hypothetical protein [Pseudaestuariivita atlantica]KNG93625.1 hypothetical protein ATO11_10475 [Pseudaestuariivita atlantica]
MTRPTRTAAAIALTLAVAPLAVEAQTGGCKLRDSLTSELETRYGEQITGAGLRSKDAMIELWQSPETGSWTMLMTRPDGTACIIAHGTDWVGIDLDTSVQS